MASLTKVKNKLETDFGYRVLTSGDDFPSRPEVGEESFLRLLDGRVDSDDRFIGTILYMSYVLNGVELTEAAAEFQKDLRRTGLVYNIQTSSPPIEARRNLSDARGAGRQVPKVVTNAILFQFKVV